MIYQLTNSREVLARVENNFDIDYSDWLPRAPLWIADALDQMQMISSYEDKTLDLEVNDYIVELPDDSPSDIRRILLLEYDGKPVRRLNTINPIKQPKELTEYSSETYSIKNGFIVCSFETGTVKLYYQAPAVEFDVELQLYFPKIPINSVIQNAIGWYLIYCMLRRGHKHPTYSLDSNNPVTNPFMMWERESKKAINAASGFDPEDRAEMSRIIRATLIDPDRPINHHFRKE